MEKIDQNYTLIIAGILAIGVEILLGAVTGFDLFLIGIIFIISGAVGKAFNSFPSALVSIVFLSFFYVLFVRKLIKQKLVIATKQTNVDSLMGKKGMVLKKITSQKAGQVKIEGEIWRAESDKEIEIDQEIVVKSVSGVTLKVEMPKI